MGVVRAILDGADLQQHDRLVSLAAALGAHTGRETWVQVAADGRLPVGGGKRVERLAERHDVRLVGFGPITECASGPSDHSVVSTWRTYRRISQSLPVRYHDQIILYASAISERWLDTTPFPLLAHRDITRVVTTESLDFAAMSRESGVGRHISLGLRHDALAARRAREPHRPFRMAAIALDDPAPWAEGLSGSVGEVITVEPESRAARLAARRADVLVTEPSPECRPEVLDGVVSQCLVLLAGSAKDCSPLVRRLAGRNPREVASVADAQAVLEEPVEDRMRLIHAGAQALEKAYVTAEDEAAAAIASEGAA